MIDLDALQSLGLVVRETDGDVGADLGSFVMVRPDRGYLVFSTDLLTSSHLHGFTLAGGVEPGPDLYTSLGYRIPAMVHDPQTDTFFLTEGGRDPHGVHVFDAGTGTRLTADSIPTAGPPTDLALLCEGAVDCNDPNCSADPACTAIPTVSQWGLAVMALLLVAGGIVVLGRRSAPQPHPSRSSS